MLKNKLKSDIESCSLGKYFLIDLIAILPFINIVFLVYCFIKKKRELFNSSLAMLLIQVIVLGAICTAFCIVYKTNPVDLAKNIRVTVISNDKVDMTESAYLEVGGKLYEIYSEKGLNLMFDDKKVVLSTPDKTSKVALYSDSGIEVGSISESEIFETMNLENPKDFFTYYEEDRLAIAEKIKINEKSSYVSYRQGYFKNNKKDINGNIEGVYTEVYVLQDVGAKTYLSIRVSDFSGEDLSDLIARHTITMIDFIR